MVLKGPNGLDYKEEVKRGVESGEGDLCYQFMCSRGLSLSLLYFVSTSKGYNSVNDL